ncbi:hypothetical protein STEG23_001322, partial [Scotinomys teguina]
MRGPSSGLLGLLLWAARFRLGEGLEDSECVRSGFEAGPSSYGLWAEKQRKRWMILRRWTILR